jgi:hypothetical protein
MISNGTNIVTSQHLQRICLQNIEEIFLADAFAIGKKMVMWKCPNEAKIKPERIHGIQLPAPS